MAQRNFTHNSNYFFGSTLFGEDTSYAIQEVNLPGLSINSVDISRRGIMGHMSGDTLTYNDLSISLIMDEKLLIWKELVEALQDKVDPKKAQGDISNNSQKMAWMIIQDDNAKEILKLNFYGVSLGGIEDMQYSSNTEDEIITCPIVVKYDYFTVGD